jgi:2-oxoglutarate dehydrogenase E1 component
MSSQWLLASRKAATSLVSRSTSQSHSQTHRWLGAASTISSRAVFSSQPIIDKHESESFLTGTSSLYAEQMFELYEQDPNSVHASWKLYFDNLSQGVAYNEADFNQPTAVASSKKAVVSGVS